MKENWRAGTMISPVPAVMVSCGTMEGEKNIITIAWTGTICSEPAMCYISVRKERHSYDMIRQSGEFVINLTTADLAKATDWCGVRSGRDFDKFAYCNLTPERCEHISAPAILEAPVNIECRVKQIIELGSHDMFIAEVVGVMVDQKLLDPVSGKLDLSRASLLGYAHGEYYTLDEKLGTFGWSVKGSTLKKEKKVKK
ncbi:MAG: flavin reductase family protein [Alistipes sp.]|nr:flavin reductase family protein [Alistipes sp.]